MTDRPVADRLSRQVKMSRLVSCNERLVLGAGQAIWLSRANWVRW